MRSTPSRRPARGVPGHLFDAVHDALIADEAVSRPVLDANPAAAEAMVGRLEDAIARGLWTPRRNAVHAELDRVRRRAAEHSGARMTVAAQTTRGARLVSGCSAADGERRRADRARASARAPDVGAARGLADVAERHGNGLIDLTRRANLQMRGVEAEELAGPVGRARELDLLDAAAEAEAVRNVLSSPLAGADP